MVVRFVRDEGKGPAPEDPGTVNALPVPPRELLDRHGARLLDPLIATVAPDRPAPRTTVYRPGVLLIPARYLYDPATLEAINDVLAKAGLVAVPAQTRGDGGETSLAAAQLPDLPDLPLRALLRVRSESDPVVVDSWRGLQYLRAAGDSGELDRQIVDSIGIEHIFFTTPVFGGVPWETSGVGGTPWETSSAGAGSTYGRTRGVNRIPVTLNAHKPRRSERCDGRRLVIAVPDTGIGPHPWFGLKDRKTPPSGHGLLVAPDIQAEILQAEQAASTVSTQLLTDFWDAPSTGQPLIGDIDTDTGHGTFIAGIIRQACPDADILAIRVIHSDGVAYEADVLLVLHLLAERVKDAQQNNRPDRMVDVISLSLGYFEESPADVVYTGQLGLVIAELTGLGVVVLAAAGNDATSRRFYPAAFADQPVAPGSGPQVISVGALNPNTTKALFSNDAPWVRCWATGAAVVSTYPTDVSGSAEPDHKLVGRASLDPDDFSAGFAVWDGTSFAAPLAAAAVGTALIDEGDLTTIDRETVIKRARTALGKA